jgi:DNA-binding GntR family transcriptional regulator
VEIDRASSVPPYRQIAGQLRAAIISGELPPGTRIPGVEQISQQYGVARMTSRKALRVLREEGWSIVTVGLGYYVAPREQWPED